LYIKGLISRMSGNISESFDLLKKCHAQNEHNPEYLKQIARALYLMGKPKSALEVASEALKSQPYDWELHHTKGLCYVAVKAYNSAAEAFQTANSINIHESTCLQLAQLYNTRNKPAKAIEILSKALETSLENTEILTQLGLLYLQQDQSTTAFQHLQNCIQIDPKNEQSILALGSALQLKGDYDEAVNKYRPLANYNQNSGQLWNNIGMCFYGKQKYIAAVACLKKAFYLEPFEWTISYNLGMHHYTTEQYTSAFHFFNNAINLKPDFAKAYMYLALTLYKLGDANNCKMAFERGMKVDSDYLLLMNYAMILAKEGDFEKSKRVFKAFEEIYKKLGSDVKHREPEVAQNYETLLSIYSLV